MFLCTHVCVCRFPSVYVGFLACVHINSCLLYMYCSLKGQGHNLSMLLYVWQALTNENQTNKFPWTKQARYTLFICMNFTLVYMLRPDATTVTNNVHSRVLPDQTNCFVYTSITWLFWNRQKCIHLTGTNNVRFLLFLAQSSAGPRHVSAVGEWAREPWGG